MGCGAFLCPIVFFIFCAGTFFAFQKAQGVLDPESFPKNVTAEETMVTFANSTRELGTIGLGELKDNMNWKFGSMLLHGGVCGYFLAMCLVANSGSRKGDMH